VNSLKNHKKFRKQKFECSFMKPVFNMDEYNILSEYGAWMNALHSKLITPITQKQKEFCDNIKKQKPPTEKYAKIFWMYLQRKKLLEKGNLVNEKILSKDDREDWKKNQKNEILMFYNNANCDIYIGTGAGKKLLNDLCKAQKSIKIVSPYLSPSLIKKLIELHRSGLEIQLITSDNIEDFHGNYEKNIHKLILQNRKIDKTAIESIKKWKQITKILSLINLGFILLFISLIYFLKDLRVILIIIPIIALSVAILIYKGEIKTKRIYSYWYTKLFPFKVFTSTEANLSHSTFAHAKIYLIDDHIAYLGSLNFTKSGTEWNYETRVRTTDPKAIKSIKNEIYDLMENSEIPERDIQMWGRKLYREPIN